MDFEQIKARYNAGETDLKNETNYILSNPSQGEDAAFAFARVVDEEIGEQAYKKVLGYIEAYQLANPLKYNQQAAIQTELKKAAIEQNRAIISDENFNRAEIMTGERNAPAMPLVESVQKPLILNLDRVKIDADKNTFPGSGGIAAGFEFKAPDKQTLIYLGIAALVFIALVYLSKK